MTEIIRKHPGISLTIIVAVMAIAFTTAAINTSEKPAAPMREIVLVAKGIMFHAEGQPEMTNPHLRLKKGEMVRLTILNEEPGQVFHCFTVPGLSVKTSRQLKEGQSETLLFAPKKTGVFTYTCMLHPMMTGKITVE